METQLNLPTKTETAIHQLVSAGVITLSEARARFGRQIEFEQREQQLRVEAEMLRVRPTYTVPVNGTIDESTATAARQMAENAGRSVDRILSSFSFNELHDLVDFAGTLPVTVTGSSSSNNVYYIGDLPATPNGTVDPRTYTTTGNLPSAPVIVQETRGEEAHRWMNDELADYVAQREAWRRIQEFGEAEAKPQPEPEPIPDLPRFGKRRITLAT